ncbi:uracil-DNA glycosylase [Bowdeniella nasicola]|uniref:Type-5 uracil-DNA glycosylase n=1 Tax=Bowdeniella nasicola TaxID=208480 RepID=A0A1Q5Q0U5_9ACTO|nr:uracil-DNA glycosylase [Bowdeniella nasicola]OKL53230.1 uracil-DNA glycosylase [Bowdeniella nasicola]
MSGERPCPLLPHPGTGELFASPVPPGTGWPGDVADASTPIARDKADVERLADESLDTEDIDARISVCRACERLVTWREDVARTKRASFADEPYWGRPVKSFGNPKSHRVIIGLAPAAHGGNRTGRMFTGDRSGTWLFGALYRAGLASKPATDDASSELELFGARIVAPVHCAPPDNKPTTAELATCAPWINRELQLLQPRALLALGGIAWQATLKTARALGWQVPRPAPKFGHGATTVLQTHYGPVRLFGCYHVSQQNTFTGRLTEAMLDDVMSQFASA